MDNETNLWVGKPFYFGLPSFTNYTVTNQRIIVEKGILTKRTIEFEFFRIRDISVKRNIIERMFGFGDITIHSTDVSNPVFVLKNIKDSASVKDMIREAVREQRNTQKIDFQSFQ